MQIEPLEVYSSESNYAIIKPPGRNYPGCVIQGDSLAILCSNALRVAERIKAIGVSDSQLLDQFEELANSLIDRLRRYQEVLTRHGIDLPYHGPIREAEPVKLLREGKEDDD